MSVYICHASIDERGAAHGGAAGDQTGREVFRRTWYAGNWSVMLRPRSATVAAKMVRFVEAVCAGNMVGYDQWQRNTLRGVARAAGWDGSKISTKCETDCSAFMTVAAEAAGINMDGAYTRLSNGTYNAPVTQTMRQAFAATGAFEIHTESKYLASSDYLAAGDILVRETGHTCMAVTDGPKCDRTSEPAELGTAIEPTRYVVTTSADPLNCRSYPGAGGAILGTFARNIIVTATRKYDGWLYVTDGTLTGWASAAYLAESEETEDDDMNISEITAKVIEAMTPEQAACIVDLAQNYKAKLAESEWATPELDEAVAMGITDGLRPKAFATREEVAIMVERAASSHMEGA